MRLFILLITVLFLSSCNSDKNSNKKIDETVPDSPALSKDSKIFLGNRLFSEKTCVTCHAINTKIKGPSIMDIMHIYKKNDADIVAFLKGNSEPIVDNDPQQIAIMQANIDGFLKKITDVELDAIATYMMHVDELQKKLKP